MSIKKLFEDANKTSNIVADTNQKDVFEPVESARNVEQKLRSQARYVPQIDYSDPANFAKYGSARLYYESAFNRILDYYPYDGSQAEITKFHNNNLDIEEYILDKRYPKSTGYITLAKDGYSISSIVDGYGVPTTNEYIDLKGGPGTGSATSLLLQKLLPNPHNDSYKTSNLYSSNVYTDAGLPSDYGKGSRQSNLRANFDDGVTVEFWMKTGSISSAITDRQVVFDSWNNNAVSSADYGRLTIELTGTVNDFGGDKNPFVITVQSGANPPRSVGSMKLLGADSLHETMGDWNHYAIRLYNTGSSGKILKTELYVNGFRSDSSSWAPYSLKTKLEVQRTLGSAHSYHIADGQYRYTSSGSLQGWWRFDKSTITTTSPEPDASGNNHTGSISAAADAPATSTSTPSAYVQATGSNIWGGAAADAVRIGTAATWDAIIGNNTVASTEMMTFAAWVYKTGDGGSSEGRIFDFGNQDIALYSDGSEALLFNAKWNGDNIVQWTSAIGVFSLNTWTHIAITYDARSAENRPKLYINGTLTAMPKTSGAQTGAYYGIAGEECVIGNNAAGAGNWAGNLADFAVWNSILDAGEIQALYYAGQYTQAFDGITELNSKNMIARIGALVTSPVSSSAPAGAGRLSGSLDEFRYWKAARTPKQIGEYWFDQVRGGANSDIANADLGVYYKFNEGITTNTAIDSIVLDYAGRAVNGVWTGYSTTSRNTGSAIVSASAAAFEFEDPIIRNTHPSIVSLKSELITSGTSYDYNNNASLMSLMPGWIQDEAADSENTDLYYINHIAGTYFDKLHLQISQLPALRHINYVSSSHKPLPFSRHLPQSLGLYAPEMFIESDVLETFADRDSTMLFENKLDETKNLIYQNLYNNLAHIFKSKGTERAMRSVLRCFNIDNGLYNVSINSNNEEYVLRNNLKHSLLRKNFLNFANLENTTGVVYQRKTGSSTAEQGSIRGHSVYVHPDWMQAKYGFTCESNIIFPAYVSDYTTFVRDSNFNTVHLFGLEQVENRNAASITGSDTTYTPGREASFRVYAVRESIGSKNVYFHLTSSRTDGLGISLTSSVFLNVYDNEPWNLSIRVEPKNSLQAGVINRGTSTPLYNVIFTGFNPKTANEIDSFKVSTSVPDTVGQQFITGSRRLLVGADRTNITGGLNYRSDVQVASLTYWTKALHDDDLKTHAVDFENIGISGSLQTISPFESGSVDSINRYALALNWNFENVTGSGASGDFTAQDYSSGSAALINGDFGWNGKLAGYQYPGFAMHFPTSSTDVTTKKEINTYKFINPEQVVASDLVQTFSDEDILHPNLRKEEIVPNYVFSIEKSIYNAVTEQMLDFFAGSVDFHNLIGDPVNTYRGRYKEIEKLRGIFFERVKSVSNVEKFLSYYKWFDESITTILSQLVPASSEFVDNLLNVVESHVLERNKYQNRVNIIDSNTFWLETDMTSAPTTAGITIGAGAGAFAFVSPPSSPRPTNKGVQYWQTRAERDISEISSGDATIDAQRDVFRNVIWSRPHPSGALPRLFTDAGTAYLPGSFARNNTSMLPDTRAQLDNTNNQIYKWEMPSITQNEIKGGTNFNRGKSLEYAYSAVYPGGPVNTDDGIFIPQNVLIGFVGDAIELTNYENISWPEDLVRTRQKTFKVQHGREWEDGIGYKNTKSEFAFPFNVLSSSVEVRSGYNKEVVDQVGRNIEITNLHNDAYGDLLEVPMQGPFTEELVGGHQSRHVPLNTGADTPYNRPEAWRLLLGTCDILPSGAIGLVGPDYPPVDFNPTPGTNPDLVYPYPNYEKAYLYRDFVAKSPVNIRNIKAVNSTNTNTVMGNYVRKYEIIHSFGAQNNPRAFVENQPTLPSQLSQVNHTTNVRTILDIHRGEQGHFEFVGDYSTSYLTGTTNKSIITTRFSAPGGIEVETRGYQDFRAAEYSPYNSIPYRNLTVQKPSQGASGSISEPAGGTPSTSRVYDIHGQDFGLYSHAARHAARFGRDSLSVTNPGASYDELPAMFKQNRNTKKIIRGYDRPETYNQNAITNTYGIMFSGSAGVTAASAHLKHSGSFKDGAGNTWTAKTFTLSTWIYHQAGIASSRAILTLGDVGATLGPAANRALLWGIDNSERIELFIQTSTGNRCKWRQTAALAAGSWYHIALTYDGTSAANEPTFYLNGVSQSMTNYDGSMSSSMQSINEHGADGNAYIAGINTGGTAYNPLPKTALDEMAIYDEVMTSAEITTLYSSGKILDLTASFAPKTASLATWMRFGDVVGDPNSNTLMTQSSGVGPTFYDKMGSNNFDIRSTSGDIKAFLISSSIDGRPAAIAPAYILGTRTVKVAYSASLYDNLNIQHQIPRSDRQYMWLSNSVVDVSNIRYAGYQYTNPGINNPDKFQREPYRTSSAGLTPYWDFVSSSNANTGSFYQPMNRLNIIIKDPVDFSNNTVGTTTIEDYMNYDLIGSSSTAGTRLPNYLNQLLASRGSNYGWGWNRTRQADNRIILNQKANNTLRMVTDSSRMVSASYRLPPLSMKGRTALVNYDQKSVVGRDVNVSLKISNTNNNIFFPELDLNNYAAINYNAVYNPLQKVLSVVRKDSAGTPLNWVLYSQNIFPSIRNEFVSSSSKRLNFDNGYWRANNAERITLGNTQPNSFAAAVSQSSWVLDAADNFLTRTSVQIAASGTGSDRNYNKYETKAGELQNTYYKYYTVPVNFLRIGATYARTHELDTMASVVSPQGPVVPQTGSSGGIFQRGSASFEAAALLNQPFGGEAVWEAPTQAGTITKAATGLAFTSASSEPWFGTYDLFNENIKLKAKGFSVVPEYRMSEHVSKYYKYGYMNKTVSDMFEIPGTIFDSSTGSFYKDFSNTDFLEGFLGTKAQTLLSASEIRISCTGAIKYNPYEGFYPAQRTQQLVAQFSSSFMSYFGVKTYAAIPWYPSVVGTNFFSVKAAGVMKNLTDCVFSPGILYNSIKSGIAVDYPVIHDASKRTTGSFGASATLTNNYALVITGSVVANSEQTTGYHGGQIWDRRIPFEAIIDPNRHLPGYQYHSMESHPSMSLSAQLGAYQNAYAFLQEGGDDIYSLMASNFFGQSTAFFLKNSGLTKLKSKTITDDLKFKPNEVYVSRIKLRRSDNGTRTYDWEYDSFSEPASVGGTGTTANTNSSWATFGAKVISSGSAHTLYDSVFPVPQDPKRNPYFQETFTMYSRPTAFGPSCAGRPSGSRAVSGAFEHASFDSFEGYNSAFTPPYTNGEAWVDLIFRPSASVSYDLERILAETKTVSWRFDAGYKVLPPTALTASEPAMPALIPVEKQVHNGGSTTTPGSDKTTPSIYDGYRINVNSMQATSSLDIFGVERVLEQKTGKFGTIGESTNKSVGKKWVISPKWESPMLNFNDKGVHKISNAAGTLTLPVYASASVSRGMWHQFGVIPNDQNTGVFMEIDTIPEDWIKNHYDVTINPTAYNDNNPGDNKDSRGLYKRAKSLAKLCGFDKTNSSQRLGDLKEKMTVKEAVVAVPYVIDSLDEFELAQIPASSPQKRQRKKFVTIPQERFDAALKEQEGSATGDSMATAGASIRKLAKAMETYVFPPQFDFLNNPDIAPMAMYVFEFSYEFDKDALSYIWQNLAPINYKKLEFQAASIAHNLGNNEILNEQILMNKNLRWMVFKVKQRAGKNYYELLPDQAGASTDQIDFKTGKLGEYNFGFNWPYDYLSFVELIKMDVDILLKK